MLVEDHRWPVPRACHVVRLARTAYNQPHAPGPFQFTFNGFLKVAFQGSRFTSDAGLIFQLRSPFS